MEINALESRIGTVAAHLLSYEYREIPKGQRTEGQKKAIDSAKGWIECMFAESLMPKGNIVEMLHDRDTNTCDAVRLRYEVEEETHRYEVSVNQTIFMITIVVMLKNVRENESFYSKDKVDELARKLFQQAKRINLEISEKEGIVLFGIQKIEQDKSSKEYDWLDTLQWWSQGTQVGFVVMKLTGPDQAAKLSRDFQPNQIWFKMLETKRTR